MDALYNFINDKATNFLGKNNKLSVGLFGGFALAGTSWLNSWQVNLTMMNGIENESCQKQKERQRSCRAEHGIRRSLPLTRTTTPL